MNGIDTYVVEFESNRSQIVYSIPATNKRRNELQ